MRVLHFSGGLFHVLISSTSLRGLDRLDTSCVDNLFIGALGGSERVILRVLLSGPLQVMTLLPGIALVLVMAFHATAVALDFGLVGRPFRLRLGSFVLSFLRTFVVGTWLASRGVDLHLLQTVVVILPGRNVPLDLGVRLALEVTTLLFHLHLENAGVNLNSEVGHILQS
jgi:hypothetical protein